MPIGIDSYAAAVGSAIKNVQFQVSSELVPRKILIIGTFDNTVYTEIVQNVPVRVYSAEQVGALVGFGSVLHRLAVQAFTGSSGVETWIIPQDDPGGAAAASGNIIFSGAATKSGYVYLYIAGLPAVVAVAKGDTAENIKTKVINEIDNLDKQLPVTAADGTGGQVDLTAKSKGDFWGNNITVRLNIEPGEELPDGVSAVVSGDKLTTGVGTPDITGALNALGTGDDANLDYFTDVVHAYGRNTTVLDAISAYVGEGNDFLGLYKKTVGRPFRVLTGDIDAGTDALSALVVLTNNRKLDRANGVIAAPGSANHPSEIAAQAIGHMARTNSLRAEENYAEIVLVGVDPGPTVELSASAGRWTSTYENRDIAVKDGISPTRAKKRTLVLQNVVTFYHPDDVSLESNGYLSMRNISIIQNMLANVEATFDQEKWKGISIVQDLDKVGNEINKEKARDVDTVLDELMFLAYQFERRAWLYTADYTIDNLPGSVTIRPGGNGFNNIFKVIFSGEGLILDTVTEFDLNVNVALS
jgi:phage tail sheath gpL-like